MDGVVGSDFNDSHHQSIIAQVDPANGGANWREREQCVWTRMGKGSFLMSEILGLGERRPGDQPSQPACDLDADHEVLEYDEEEEEDERLSENSFGKTLTQSQSAGECTVLCRLPEERSKMKIDRIRKKDRK